MPPPSRMVRALHSQSALSLQVLHSSQRSSCRDTYATRSKTERAAADKSPNHFEKKDDTVENHAALIDSTSPVVLVIGTTGQVGRRIVDEFDREPGDVRVRYAARKPE